MLPAFNYNWGGIELRADKFVKRNIELFQMKFAKLIGAAVQISKNSIDKHTMVYISGGKQSKCTKEETDFVDSLDLSKVLTGL